MTHFSAHGWTNSCGFSGCLHVSSLKNLTRLAPLQGSLVEVSVCYPSLLQIPQRVEGARDGGHSGVLLLIQDPYSRELKTSRRVITPASRLGTFCSWRVLRIKIFPAIAFPTVYKLLTVCRREGGATKCYEEWIHLII